MSSQNINPYQAETGGTTIVGSETDARRWPQVVAILACAYFITSAVTLPFADHVWVGEAPLLAIVQLPKSFFKSVVHQIGMVVLSAVGLSRGSHSPDYGATHLWAMGVMTAVPAVALVTLLASLGSIRRRRLLIATVLLSASLDAIVTFWFEDHSRLSLYNAVYF